MRFVWFVSCLSPTTHYDTSTLPLEHLASSTRRPSTCATRPASTSLPTPSEPLSLFLLLSHRPTPPQLLPCRNQNQFGLSIRRRTMRREEREGRSRGVPESEEWEEVTWIRGCTSFPLIPIYSLLIRLMVQRLHHQTSSTSSPTSHLRFQTPPSDPSLNPLNPRSHPPSLLPSPLSTPQAFALFHHLERRNRTDDFRRNSKEEFEY